MQGCYPTLPILHTVHYIYPGFHLKLTLVGPNLQVVPPKGYQAHQGEYDLKKVTINTPIRQHVSTHLSILTPQDSFIYISLFFTSSFHCYPDFPVFCCHAKTQRLAQEGISGKQNIWLFHI